MMKAPTLIAREDKASNSDSSAAVQELPSAVDAYNERQQHFTSNEAHVMVRRCWIFKVRSGLTLQAKLSE